MFFIQTFSLSAADKKFFLTKSSKIKLQCEKLSKDEKKKLKKTKHFHRRGSGKLADFSNGNLHFISATLSHDTNIYIYLPSREEASEVQVFNFVSPIFSHADGFKQLFHPILASSSVRDTFHKATQLLGRNPKSFLDRGRLAFFTIIYYCREGDKIEIDMPRRDKSIANLDTLNQRYPVNGSAIKRKVNDARWAWETSDKRDQLPSHMRINGRAWRVIVYTRRLFITWLISYPPSALSLIDHCARL